MCSFQARFYSHEHDFDSGRIFVTDFGLGFVFFILGSLFAANSRLEQQHGL